MVQISNFTEKLKTSKVPKLAKIFASSEYKLRNKGYKITHKVLKTSEFGSGKGKLSWEELIALCKGLHYWLWMQDKMILHEEVVEKICALVDVMENKELCHQFIKCIFETEHREWDTLDTHRVDKFMMLIRDFLAKTLAVLKRDDWADLDWFISVITANVANPDLNRSFGLKMHFVYILLGELLKVEAGPRQIEAFVQMYSSTLAQLPMDHVLSKSIRKQIFDELLSRSDDGESIVDMKKVGQQMFDIGRTQPHIRAKNRKMLYAIALRFGILNDTSQTFQSESMDVDLQPSKKKKKNKSKEDNSVAASESAHITESPAMPSELRGKKRAAVSPSNTAVLLQESPIKSPSPKSQNQPPMSPKSRSPKSQKQTPVSPLKTPSPKSKAQSPASQNHVVLDDQETTPQPPSKRQRPDASTPQSDLSIAPLMSTSISLNLDADHLKGELKKRVSFGKIYRKPFRKGDKLTPQSVKVNKSPDKGILKPIRLSLSYPQSVKPPKTKVAKKGKAILSITR